MCRIAHHRTSLASIYDPFAIHLRSACACAGVDTEVYTQEWFDTDYQVMLWDVAFEMLLGAGRDLLAMPPLTKETPFRTPES